MESGKVLLSFRFFQAGGEIETLTDFLADNYVGMAQSANLLANWLIVIGKIFNLVFLNVI